MKAASFVDSYLSQSVLFAAEEYVRQGTAERPRKTLAFSFYRFYCLGFHVLERILKAWTMIEILFELETF